MSNKKWILFITPNAYPCNVGGLEVFNHYLINELKEYYPIHVLTRCDKVNFDKVTVHKFNWCRLSKVSQPLLVLFFIFKNRNSIRLIHLSYSRSYWTYWAIFVFAKKIFGIKYFFTIHGGGLTKWKPKLPYKSFFKNAEVITGVSDRIMNEYTKRSSRRIIYTPPLVPFKVIAAKEIHRKYLNLNIDDKVILYVGSLKPLKSVDTLIEALGVISKEKLKRYNIKVLIAGDGISKDSLIKKSIELGLENIVKFLGFVDKEEIHKLYSVADIYTICSKFEGLPISLLEAFANGLPSISSDAPGLVDISNNNENSLLFKTKDSSDYAEKIEILVNDENLQERIKKNAKNYYNKNFSFDILIEDFKNIINGIG